ncbi:MAG: bifunctional diaminohydroxyphosphoribosylaminopyrimidine deaminase/5-amino-6-(5-phosphoribosylamino)uracil reductase RibD [Gammaproteobacteria bacterium]|nr:bifunctional diaminohydroxyphosphoribosylaminopyrimidine deaminase/5-amino-6-(5-phosphoribosylamino)uracil reductase RibD [Gammaproteobacteria bacterium]
MKHTNTMREALKLAELGKYTVSPNPAVGCVLLKRHKIVGRGWHQAAGQAHAEIVALRQAGSRAQGATLYVTLEPCCHYGRTPPCVDAIINAGIKKVYVASMDPNPQVKGQGTNQLRQAGIEVNVGLCDAENRELNRSYFHYHRHQRPWVIAKWAMSLDGKMVVNDADDRQISSLSSQQRLHKLRNRVDAILIGAKTAILDDPQLSVRLCDLTPIRQPQPIILSRHGKLPLNLQLMHPERTVKTVVATTAAVDRQWQQAAENQGVEVVVLPDDNNGQIDLTALLDYLGQRGMTTLLVEGGQSTHHHFFAANCVNECQCHLAPVLIGPWQQKRQLAKTACEMVGADWHYATLLTEEE